MKLFLIVLTILLMSACVTTNIYFPTPDVENAADKIVADVWPPADKVVVTKKEKK